jgi:uncharacterized protein (TIGR03067 family)
MRKHALTVVAASLSLAFAPAPLPKPDATKADKKKLQGAWERLSYTRGGKPVPLVAPNAGPVFAVVDGDHLTYRQGTLVHGKWAFTLDAKKAPKVMDMKWVNGLDGRTHHGIYALEGDTLIVCSTSTGRAEDRPKDLSGTGPGHTRQVFRRSKR